MGSKIMWGGLTLVTCSPLLGFIPSVNIVGMVIMVIGYVLYVLE